MLSEIYEAVFRLFGLFCHQMPERSLFLLGVQLPLCLRCTALLAGSLGTIVYLVFRLPIPSQRLSFALTLPTFVELAASRFGIAESGNPARAVTGLLFGFFFPMGAMVWLAARGRIRLEKVESTNRPPPICPRREAS